MKRNRKFYFRRTAWCILLLVLAFVLQSSLGVQLSIWGTHIDFLPIIVASAAVYMGPTAGLFCGFAAGLLYDVSGSGLEGIYPLYFILCGIAAGEAGKHIFYQWKIFGITVCALGSILLQAAVRYLFVFQFQDMSLLLFAQHIGKQLILSVIISPIVAAILGKLTGNVKNQTISYMNPMEGDSNG